MEVIYREYHVGDLLDYAAKCQICTCVKCMRVHCQQPGRLLKRGVELICDVALKRIYIIALNEYCRELPLYYSEVRIVVRVF